MILLFETANARVEHSGKKTYLEGIYMVGGRVNNNNRFYKTEMLSDLVSDLQPTIKEGGLLGELGHNNEATTPDYNRVSHVVQSLRHTGNGEFFGRAEVLKEGAGKVLQSCIDAGARIGISTKGQGQTQKMKDVNGNIYELVLPDYKLISCDAVHSPSAPGAFVKAIQEGIMSKKFTITESALAIQALQSLGHGLAQQQERMEYSPADDLYRGHSGYPSLGDDPRSHYERLLADTLAMIEQLADLQSRMRDTDGSAMDDVGISTLRHRYADAIRDPIRRAQVKQQLWNARTNEIMRKRAMAQLSRLGKFERAE